MGFIWLCGNRAPDHNSLWRFWRANRFGYNAQAVVDDQSQIIVAAEAVNEPNDLAQLAAMMEQAQENVRMQWALVCAASDLHKIYRKWRQNALPGGPETGGPSFAAACLA